MKNLEPLGIFGFVLCVVGAIWTMGDAYLGRWTGLVVDYFLILLGLLILVFSYMYTLKQYKELRRLMSEE